jgi:ribonuclease HI
MIKVFTDGSCPDNPGVGGWGVIIEIDGKIEEFSGDLAEATNNTAEIMAALEGLRRTPEGAEVELTCDSNYVVKGMTEWIVNWKRSTKSLLSERSHGSGCEDIIIIHKMNDATSLLVRR